MKKPLHYLIRKEFIALLISFLLINATYAQHLVFGSKQFKVEVGLNFGPTFFLGDLGGHRGIGTTFIKDLNLPVTKFMKGLFLGIYPNEWLGFRVAAQATYVEGRDNLIKDMGGAELDRKNRNLDFKSDITEAYGAIEIFPIMFIKQNDEEYQPKLRPYFFGGLGIFHFNPQGSLTDANGNVTWHYLQPLHTEGEGFPEYPNRHNYKLTQLNIPMGGGLKYFVSETVNLGVELLYRKTFTDYIDDVSTDYINHDLFIKYLSAANANLALQLNDKAGGSNVTRTQPGDQRGNPKNNDAYFSLALKVGIRLGNNNNTDAASRTRCPERF